MFENLLGGLGRSTIALMEKITGERMSESERDWVKQRASESAMMGYSKHENALRHLLPVLEHSDLSNKEEKHVAERIINAYVTFQENGYINSNFLRESYETALKEWKSKQTNG